VKKNALRLDAYGTIDELSSVIVLARTALADASQARSAADPQTAHDVARARRVARMDPGRALRRARVKGQVSTLRAGRAPLEHDAPDSRRGQTPTAPA